MHARTISFCFLAPFIVFSPLFADTAGDALLAKSPFVSSTFSAYTFALQKIEAERARAVINLNEKFLAELSRAKSVALKNERLDDANAIEAKIKEVTEENAAIKTALNGKAPAASQSEPTGPHQKLVTDYLKENKDVDNPKIRDFISGKLVVQTSTGITFFFKNGQLGLVDRRTHTFSIAEDLKVADGKILFHHWGIALSNLGLHMKGKPYPVKFSILPKADLTAEDLRVDAAGGKTSAPHRGPVKEVDPDNTAFGRRAR